MLKSLSRPTEAILALVELLEQSPADAEAWAELSELYSAQGMYKQAVFCLEEVLLIMPNAWNVCITSVIHFVCLLTATDARALRRNDIHVCFEARHYRRRRCQVVKSRHEEILQKCRAVGRLSQGLLWLEAGQLRSFHRALKGSR